MSVQRSVAVRNAQLDALEATIGPSPILEIHSGLQSENCAASDGTPVLVQFALPADWLSDAANGIKSKLGTWPSATVAADGLARHYRLMAGSICHEQGPVHESWKASTDYASGAIIANNGGIYICATGGTSASSGGPTGIGAGIADGAGALTWSYSGKAALVMSAVSLTAGQSVQITSYSVVAGNP